MEKSIKTGLTAITLLLLFSVHFAHATPMQYVFSGHVTSAQYDPVQLCGSNNCLDLQVGAPVSFVTLIDFTVNPSNPRFADQPIPWELDYFSAQYLSGPSFSANKNITAFNNNFGFGVDSPSGWMAGVLGSLFADAGRGADFGDAPLKIYSPTLTVSQWEPGENVWGIDNLGPFGEIRYELELESVTNMAVPEPSTLILLGSSLVGLIGLRKRIIT